MQDTPQDAHLAAPDGMARAEPINCPFCGGAAICDPVPAGNAGSYYKVFCRSVLTCGAAGSARPDRDDAVGMWNRRAGQHVTATEPPLFWRCFHCEHVARTREQAIEHFGLRMNERPASCLGNENPAFLLPKQASAAGSTDAEHAAWLADKIVACGDYAKEAAQMLRRWPA